MEELEDGIIYASIGNLNFKFTVETLFEIIDGLAYDEEDDYDQECDQECEQECECSSNTLNKCYEHVLNLLNSDDHIIAFEYNDLYTDDRRECIGKCLGIFNSGAEAERELKLPRNTATKIANTWMHAIENDATSINDVATTNGWTTGQWTTYSTDFNNHRIMLCYPSSLYDLHIADEPKKSLVNIYF